MKRKRLISLFLAMMMLFSIVIPIGSAFAEEATKYHPKDWFGYTHSKEEIAEWITDAVKYPTTSEDAIKALTGEIRPGDTISLQVEVEMPTGHEEIIKFLKNFRFDMTLPFGTIEMIEVYSSDAPLLTDEEYEEKVATFNNSFDEIENALKDEAFLEDVEVGLISKSELTMFFDLVENRDVYYDIYLKQLETARTKYGLIDNSYGTAKNWMGAFQDNPFFDFDEGMTFETFKKQIKDDATVSSKLTDEEFDKAVADFDECYPLIIEEYLSAFEEAKTDEAISENDLLKIETAIESINDGTFYDTVIKYFEDCRDGYSFCEDDYAARFFALTLAGMDICNPYLGQYCFDFSDEIVQSNTERTYIFDINLVATNALSVGGYISLPSLHWMYIEDCPSYWISLFPFQSHNYYPCNSRNSSFLNFGTTYYVNNLFNSQKFSDIFDYDDYLNNDKRYLAIEYISSKYNDDQYKNKFLFENSEQRIKDHALNAVRPFTVECLDEYGNLIKSETFDAYDAYYNIVPEDIYDYRLIGPENIEGYIENEDTTVTFYYEHKDAEIKVRYVDFDGNELIPARKIKGKTLEGYQAVPPEIYGYNLIETPKNASGILHEDSADIQFVYKLKASAVSVNYLDTEGNKIAKSEMIYGKMFDEYSTVPKEFDGYELVEIPDNASGKMTEEVTQVNYIYKLLKN